MKEKNTIRSLFRVLLPSVFLVLLLALSACGRKALPRPPEDFAPQPARFFAAKGAANGIVLEWQNSLKKADGSVLNDLAYYRVDRAKYLPEVLPNFRRIARLSSSLPEPEAVEATKKRPGLSIADRDEKGAEEQFRFLDQDVEQGGRYVYRIVPVNTAGVEGVSEFSLKVTYLGEASQVELYSPGRDGYESTLGNEL